MGYLLYQETNEKIGYITIQNDKQRNALARPLLRELYALLEKIEHERRVNVVVIQAEGKVFSSGHNLNEIVGQSDEDVETLAKECMSVMAKIRSIPQIVIAKVHGLATAAGAQLVAVSDLAIASEKAQFGTPGANIGLFCTAPAVFLSRNVGRKKVAQMLFTAKPISAEDALAHGLVNFVVPDEDLDQETEELALSVARHSLVVLGYGKELLYQQLQMEDFQALNYANKITSLYRTHPDAVEGITAFLEKRQPVWADRRKAGEEIVN